jgi:hypothetical protein
MQEIAMQLSTQQYRIDTTHVLAILRLMELAVHQSLRELMSDWSKRQSYGELTTRKILRSSPNITNLQRLIKLH